MASLRGRSAAWLLPCALAACGPIGATSLIGDAEVALARAHAADGEKLAPYETTLADLYLVKAREEQGNAHYADARALAGDCVKVAELAARKAAERRSSPAAVPDRPAEKAPSSAAPRVVPAPLVAPSPAEGPDLVVPKKPRAAPAEPAEPAPQSERKPAPLAPVPPDPKE